MNNSSDLPNSRITPLTKAEKRGALKVAQFMQECAIHFKEKGEHHRSNVYSDTESRVKTIINLLK